MKAVIVLALIAAASAAILSRPSEVTLSKGSRLIGGEDAGEREFPFVVSIEVFSGGFRIHLCAGVIYDERRIITAGYCLEYIDDPQDLTIVAGIVDLSNREDEVTIQVASAKIHESYNNPEYDFNIGILTLAEPLIFNQNIQPIRLAIPTIEASGEIQVVGWGKRDDGSYAAPLQKITLNVVDRDVCTRDFARIGVSITENMVCASAPRRSTCDGDGGGPLIAKDEARRPYLAGVVSWTLDPCAVDGYHSLFTNIAPLRSWLDSNLN